MKKSHRPGRHHQSPTGYADQGWAGLERRWGSGAAARLAGAAGTQAGRLDDTLFEPLEQRRLLFSLTVTADTVDPNTGLGTVQADFGYVIPYLFKAIPAPTTNMTVTETFDDEMAPWTMLTPATPPPGTFFDQSDFRITYTSLMGAARWVAVPVGGTNRDLDIQLTGNDSVTFGFYTGVMAMMPRLRQANAATVLIGNASNNGGVMPGFANDGEGLRTDPTSPQGSTKIELLRNGVAVQTFSGAGLVAIRQAAGDGFRYNLTSLIGFDSFRISSLQSPPDNNTYRDTFRVETITATFPAGRFAAFDTSRIFGARAVLTGPVGASARFLDLYGRDIVATLNLGVPDGAVVPIVDPNDDGVPDFNDGFGKVILTGTNVRSNLAMWGGTIETVNMALQLVLPQDMLGFFGAFEGAGFGFALTRTMPPTVIGLPPGTGSLIIGSPYVRDNSSAGNYLAQAALPVAADFVRSDQGFFVPNNESMGSIMANAVLFGSSQFSQSLGRLNVGYLLGSVTVAGDLGTLAVASDAGLWVRDDFNPATIRNTSNALNVGRTVGEVLIAGRSTMDIEVRGDVNGPIRPVLNFREYAEREVVYGFDPATPDGVRATILTALGNNADPATQGMFFGNAWFRNDTIMSAEYVGYDAAAVHITGTLGLRDPVNMAEDASDVYAFAASGATDVVVDATFLFPGQNLGLAYARVVDADGRVVATHELPALSRQMIAARLNQSVRFAFRPDRADVYYLVLSTPVDGRFDTGLSYDVTVSGLAPTTFGSLRTGAGLGSMDDPPVVSVVSGSMGALRVGTGFVDGSGMEASPSQVINTNQNNDNLFVFNTSTTSVAGTLYNIITGSDVGDAGVPQLFVGGDLGSFITGMSPVVGQGPTQGDIDSLDLTVAGRIGVFDVRGAISWEQDMPNPGPAGPTFIRTGTGGGHGDIGSIFVGAFVYSAPDGSAFVLTTSPGSVINQFIVGTGGGTGDLRGGTPRFMLGAGSDLRFAEFSSIASAINPNSFTPLVYGQSVTLTDDAGANVTFLITGGRGLVVPLTSVGAIRFMPILGPRGGVAVARIDLTLNGGADLQISGSTPGVVSIGRLNVTTDGTGGSSILIDGGPTEIDVWQIDVTGTRLAAIRNNSPNSDIVAIDAVGVDQISIAGDLGRTQTNGFGPSLLGPVLGLQSGLNTTVGGPLGITPGSMNATWSGAIDVAVNATTANPGQETLEDLGSPLHRQLNGAVIRNGNVTLVQVGGAIGDFILQGGNLLALIANSDGLTVSGRFDGIVGTVYATNVVSVDVGDGLAGQGPSPFAAAGIFADNDVQAVFGGRGLHPVIRGLIGAANSTIDIGPNVNGNGVVLVSVTGGRYDGATISAGNFDSFWHSARYTLQALDDDVALGDVVGVQAVDGDLFRTTIFGRNVVQVSVMGGAYDATHITALGNIGLVAADEFRNSTRLGEPLEVLPSLIEATLDVNTIRTNNLTGDIADLAVNIQGSITGTVSAMNLTRVDLRVANVIQDIFAGSSVRGSNVVAGHLVRLFATNNLRSSSLDIAGAIEQVMAGQNITSTEIKSSGPDGRIDMIQSRFFLTGSIESSGPIGTITSTDGDIIASIRTNETDGTLHLLEAGGNLLVTLDIASDVGTLRAGRNIGQQSQAAGSRVINVRGSLDTISVPNGQVYTDVRVGQGITGTIRTGRVAALPGSDLVSTASITAYGRINALDFNGDVNGSIISHSGGIGTVRITNGSFRPGNTIEARDGSIDSVVITGGHLMGSIIAEEAIGQVLVLAGSDGFWGDIGVNPYLSQFAPFDALRNQLPPGVAPVPTFQGPQIRAGTNIGEVRVEKANFWESSIVAGHSIGTVFIYGVVLNDNITPGLGGSFFVAGDSIVSIEVNQFVGGAIINAGITDLGQDRRPGGTGANTDTVQFGRIGDLTFRGGTGAVTISAGMNAGADGVYNTADDTVANGISSVNSVTVTGDALVTTVFADNGIGFTSPGIIKGGPGLQQFDPGRVIPYVPAVPEIAKGVPVTFVTAAGETGTVTFNGPGQAYFETAMNRLVLINTTLASSLTVDGATLTNVGIVSNDGSSIGSLTVRPSVFGSSYFYFDGYIQDVSFGYIDSTGTFGAGGDVGTLTMGPLIHGTIDANFINSVIIGGDVGVRTDISSAGINLLAGESIRIGGNLFGLVNIKRDLGSVTIMGAMDRAAVRSGRSIGSFSAASVSDSRISARNDLTTINVTGDVTSSLFSAGTDLGSDGLFGGTGTAADTVTNGNISTVTIGGNFRASDISAGAARGADGFLGTADDKVDEGHSSIGSVTIDGTQVGSNVNSQSYRIKSNGTIGTVTVGGQNFVSSGNFAVEKVNAAPDAVQVKDLRVIEDSRLYTAFIDFNQPIDQSTLGPALNVFEVRTSGTVITTIRLSQNVDYLLEYDAPTREARITFDRSVTDRSLPQIPGRPGPGVYRFTLDAAILRGQTQSARLDGNGDGVAAGNADSFSQDDIVGDAGDKLTANTVVVGGHTIDFYPPANLDLVLDNNYTPDGLPDTNKTFTIRGTLGDHPDTDVNVFRSSGDVDLYKVTLLAGQILRLGPMQGVAQLADRVLLNASGQALTGNSAQAEVLPSNLGGVQDLTFEQQYLIKQTGTYYIAVSVLFSAVNVTDPTVVTNIPPIAGTTGRYSFTLEVFDDGDTGFAADTNSGNGVPVVNAPLPAAFAGADGILGTADDLATVTVGAYTFTLQPGADGVRGTADDIVDGSNGSGITSRRTAGPDGIFGTSDDRLESFVGASIGEPNFAGVPHIISPDIDVYHLNNGQPIAAGTHIRATLQLTEFGSNLGLTPPNDFQQDLRGDVHFALFETTNGAGIDGATLVAAPSDFLPIGGKPNTVTTDGVNSYGFDANGDFFMDFLVPGAQGVGGAAAASYALYVQGAIRSDYGLVIVTQGVGTVTTRAQNILIETRGGTINWLEAGQGVTTQIGPYNTSVAGFSGLIGAQRVDDYVMSTMLSNLNAVFVAANVNVTISRDPAAFEGQPFSTVFVSATNDPTAFFNNASFGASQHSDAFNADRNDQAVVFIPSLALLGDAPSIDGVNSFIQSLTAAVGRRIGELVGLRTLGDTGAGSPVAIMAANSVTTTPAGGIYRFSTSTRSLSDGTDELTDTNFYLGRQNDVNLLDRILQDHP